MTHDNTDRGALWPNRDKQKDTHPDFRGRLNVNGVEYWVSAWKRKPDANPKAPSLTFSIQPKEEADRKGLEQVRKATPPAQAASDGFNDFDDDIPF